MSTSTHAPNAAELPRAIAQIEQRLYILHHEARLVADLAAVGQHARRRWSSMRLRAFILKAYTDGRRLRTWCQSRGRPWRKRVNDGTAPQPVRIGKRCISWRGIDVLRWLADPVGYASRTE